MADLREAAQQALEALRGYRRELGCEQPCDAEQALEAALEQPEPAAERARIITMLREMHEKVAPIHNFYAYAANCIEAME